MNLEPDDGSQAGVDGRGNGVVCSPRTVWGRSLFGTSCIFTAPNLLPNSAVLEYLGICDVSNESAGKCEDTLKKYQAFFAPVASSGAPLLHKTLVTASSTVS